MVTSFSKSCGACKQVVCYSLMLDWINWSNMMLTGSCRSHSSRQSRHAHENVGSLVGSHVIDNAWTSNRHKNNFKIVLIPVHAG